ncbi:MAG: anaerobic carbon-monoxide dehydrogenase catalytic subunit [Armatimonadetes bacterium]|nr:anaerobic carbon-monoxide dehydrogenase catalytic subunit [Armatimonadota bacterium]
MLETKDKNLSKLAKKSVDPAAQEILKHAEAEGISTVWDRFKAMQPQCGFGLSGLCCRICHMGPCRISPFADGPQRGICGADADLMVTRNLTRQIAVGTSAHGDHARSVAHALILAAEGKGGYQIADEVKLHKLASEWGIKTDGRKKEEIAKEIGHLALEEFGKQEGTLRFINRVPKKRREIWEKYGLIPRAIDLEVSQTLNRTTIGVDNDYKNLIFAGIRTALANGWGGSMIATELQDIIFGRPRPIRSQVNLGVLKEDEVNVLVHGHEPVLSAMLVKASRDPEILAKAKASGAGGINLAGICCTANEIMMRYGIPIAGNYLHQELALITGAVEAMIVDVQCVIPSLTDLANCFHTEIITTSPKGKSIGSVYIEFHEENALQIAKEILMRAIKNYPNRQRNKVDIPKEKMDLVGGFSTEEVFTFLGGKYRATYRPLNDAIINGRLRGVAAIVGCNNPHFPQDYGHLEMAKALLKNDVLVVETGCSAIACAKYGMLKPEAAYEYAGRGLREICEAVGIPPILHLGACVDISRILTACVEVIKEGGLGVDFSDLPVAGAAPEWMSEKAITIAHYVIGTGIYTVLGGPLSILGSKNVTNFLCNEIEELLGGKFAFEPDPVKGAELMINHINKKRAALKLRPMMYQ